jgi:hypothetical protein
MVGNLGLKVPLKTAENFEQLIVEFNNVIRKGNWSSAPEDKPQAEQSEYPWQFTDKIKGKRKLQRRGQIRRHPEDKRRYNEVTTKLKG